MQQPAPRIGSLFSGYGGLDMAVSARFGARTAWHCQWEPPDKKGRPDLHQYAAQILAHHYPGVPNLGDITQVDWDQVEPVDILTGGFPCTDVSLAGKRAGLNGQTRSGLWAHMARAINALRPKLVVIENVRGLLSAAADGDVEPCTWCLGDGADEPVLRALGAVLADLAGLGFDAEWVGLPASAVGAPHERFRVFILAWPADAEGPRLEVGGIRRLAAGAGEAALVAASVGRRSGPRIDDGVGAALGGAPTADADEQRAHRGGAHGAGRPEPADGRADAPAHAGSGGRGPAERDVQPGEPDADWGAYGPAIRRWEHVLGRRAPRPVDDRGRLSPVFVEWMMGLPAGWMTDVPLPAGMTESQARNAQLKAGGNGVVPQQAYAAIDELWYRATVPACASAAA
jgi:DNA (cytosine-5)-methyltransferase 1